MSQATASQATADFRIPPQTLESEEAVLGAMILSPEAIPKVLAICQESDFYREAHRKLFKAIVALYGRKEPIDMVTLINELTHNGDFENLGGTLWLTKFLDVPSAANAEFYAEAVKDRAARRQVITFTNQIQEKAYSDSFSAHELLPFVNKLASQTLEAVNNLACVDDSSSALAEKVVSELQESWSGNGRRFVKTGFNRFDEKIGGFERKKFHLITGAPSVGKSTFIQQCALQMALNGTAVGYACLDTDSIDIHLRMVCQTVGLDYKSLWRSDLSYEKRSEILERLALLGDLPMRIVGEDEIGRTFEKFASWAYNAVTKYGVQCIFIDSAAKFYVPLDRGQTMEMGLTRLINDINSLSKQLDIPIVTIHELNRGDNPSPKGSGTFDYVARYWFNIERDPEIPSIIHMEVRKNSNGPNGIKLNFQNIGAHFLLEEIA